MHIFSRILVTLISTSSVLLVGCSEDKFEAFEDPGVTSVTTNPGVISQKNFSILASDWAPAVINPDDGSFTKTDVTLTVYTGDRNNQTITDGHRVYFESEYGLINPSFCDTGADGTCEVTWSAIDHPGPPSAPGGDFRVTITAYTLGEEAFTDSNGNSVFDDGDAGFEDIEEPYNDADWYRYPDGTLTAGSNIFSAGDTIIDVVSTNDPTGVNLQHDFADGFFNGGGCTHSSLCGTRTSITIWDDIILYIDGPPAAP